MKTRNVWLWALLPALALAAGTAPAPSGAAEAAAAGVVKINVGKDAIKPPPAQTAAIRHAAAADLKELIHPEQGGYLVALADLNDDSRADLLVHYDDIAFCGSSGCSGVIVMATAHGYASNAIRLPNFSREIDILPTKHHGMHDLQFDDGPVWTWNGQEYDVPGSKP